jgi:signal transduction histidine kinase
VSTTTQQLVQAAEDALACPTVAELRRIDLFDDLDEAGVERWANAARVRLVPAGTVLSEQGEEPPGLQLLLDGRAQAMLRSGALIEPLSHQVAPTWIGAISSLTGRPAAVRMQAETDCRVALIPRDEFERLVLSTPAVHRRIMRQIAPVMDRINSVQRERERLAALGTMSAGLAHELNNPAAAAQRASSELAEALEVLGSTIGAFVEAGVEREQARRLVELKDIAFERAAERAALDSDDPAAALEAADAEEELVGRLEALGVEQAWRLAEPLAAAGVDEAWLSELAAEAGTATPAALAWVAASLTARSLVEELHESTGRISDLVGAVKRYAYMDRGGAVEVDIHEGLKTTMTVLWHKLKHTDIQVVKDLDKSLPKVTVRGSELNQVWTNLLDNAIEALDGHGTITIRTRRDGPCATVEISDDGPGIPADVLPRVFDPFFTTKEVGQGTGLGLDVARRIVVDRHDGSITADSRPGATTFRVRIPLAKGPSAA